MRMNCLFLFILLVPLFIGCSYEANEFDPLENCTLIDHPTYIEMTSDYEEPVSCLLFYPGAKVEPEAYITPFYVLCLHGYKVIIVKATADLAIFNVKRAEKIVKDFPEIEHWILAGHSLGGVVAIKAILRNENLYDGLILLASYPAKGDDLSGWNGAVLSLTAENDSLTKVDDIENAKALLPEGNEYKALTDFQMNSTAGKTIYYQIPGGNHAQFGNYGVQKNDGVAEITADAQHDIVFWWMYSFMVSNKFYK